ncbi:hypothetical protein G6F56_011960 [Rhizopus delemar]|nr:hypothetical protein G6F56_011960 [Rhizopus delemar]
MSLEETKKLQDKLGYADVPITAKTHITIKEPKPQRPIAALERKKSFQPVGRTESTEDIKQMASKLYEMADKMLQSLSLDDTLEESRKSPEERRKNSERRKSPEERLMEDRYRPPKGYYYYYHPRAESPPLDYYYVRRRKSSAHLLGEKDYLDQKQLKRKHSARRLPDYYYDNYYYR